MHYITWFNPPRGCLSPLSSSVTTWSKQPRTETSTWPCGRNVKNPDNVLDLRKRLSISGKLWWAEETRKLLVWAQPVLRREKTMRKLKPGYEGNGPPFLSGLFPIRLYLSLQKREPHTGLVRMACHWFLRRKLGWLLVH